MKLWEKENRQMKRTTKTAAKKAQLAVVRRDDHNGLLAHFAPSLMEGLEETFTVNRLKLTPALMRCLSTTDIIENPNGTVRRVTNRVCGWRDSEVVLRWMASTYFEAEKNSRDIQGYRDPWVLSSVLGTASYQS
jgi:putative transposase